MYIKKDSQGLIICIGIFFRGTLSVSVELGIAIGFWFFLIFVVHFLNGETQMIKIRNIFLSNQSPFSKILNTK